MDDLVKRMRDRRGGHISGLYDDQAADAIERLTNERDALQAKLDAAEPVAMRYISGAGKRWRYLNYPYTKGWDFPASLGTPQPLYAAPPDFDALQRKYDALIMECCKRSVFSPCAAWRK